MIDVEKIRDVIPHRYPFLLIDRIVDANEEWTSCTGIKNITATAAAATTTFVSSGWGTVVVSETLTAAADIWTAAKQQIHMLVNL